MKSASLVLFLFVASSGTLCAQSANIGDTGFKGHMIGESVADFLRLEPEAQQEADVCRQRPDRRSCAQLVAAIDHSQRAEISTTGSANFVLDAGRLVKITMIVNASFDSASESVAQEFGPVSNNASLPSQNSSGAKWQNQLATWDTPSVYVTLYQDNNPVLQDNRPLLVVESRAEHILKDLNQPQSAAVASSFAFYSASR
jgi:hypothetical protein